MMMTASLKLVCVLVGLTFVLLPARSASNRERARAALNRIRERTKAMNLGPFDWEEWRKFRDEGRR